MDQALSDVPGFDKQKLKKSVTKESNKLPTAEGMLLRLQGNLTQHGLQLSHAHSSLPYCLEWG